MLAAITVTAATTTASLAPDKCVAPIVVPAPRHISRFFGFTPDSSLPESGGGRGIRSHEDASTP